MLRLGGVTFGPLHLGWRREFQIRSMDLGWVFNFADIYELDEEVHY